MSNEKDYRICFKETVIYLPCNDNYKIIATAIKQVCELFDNNITIDKEDKQVTERSENTNVLIVCDKNELVEMVKYHDSYWIEPKKLDIKHLINPDKAQKFKDNIVNDVYNELMNKLSHR